VKVFDLFVEPEFKTLDEKDYTLNIVARWEQTVAKIFLLLCALSWFPLVALSMMEMIGARESKLLTFYGFLIGVWCLSLLVLERQLPVLKRHIFTILMLSQIVWGIAAYIDITDGEANKALIRVWWVYTMLGCLFLPLSATAHRIVFFVTVPMSVWVTSYYPNPAVDMILAFFSLVIGQNIQILTRRFLTAESIRTFRDKSKYIPRQVLMKAARTNESILDVFKPSDRFCVCICSDWRDFHGLIAENSASDVGANLVRYYEHVVDRLAQKFPDGQFFVDWIADELFIVVFSENVGSDPVLVQKSFELAQEMLAYRTTFASMHGYPVAVDIGLAAGLASVGIFGQGGIAKATAFSSTPGNARRLQEVSKRLGVLHGLNEKIVMSSEYVNFLGETPLVMTRLPLSESLKVKDLDDLGVYVWPQLSGGVGEVFKQSRKVSAA
jgi:hypothetical protein